MLRGVKNKYAVFRWGKGTIEDLFPLHRSVQALNTLYPGEPETAILESDFEKNRSFLESVNDILWTKRKTTFQKKTSFGTLVALMLRKEEIPSEIVEALQVALLLIEASQPLRLRFSEKQSNQKSRHV